MTDVHWICVDTGLCQNRKIAYLRSLPNGNDYALIWIFLLTFAGRCNEGGKIYFAADTPYTLPLLAWELGYDEGTIKSALEVFSTLRMVTLGENGLITITDWCNHQNYEGLERIRAQNRARKARQRSREKGKALVTGQSRDCPALEETNKTGDDRDDIHADSPQQHNQQYSRHL